MSVRQKNNPLRNLNDCGCCQGLTLQTPLKIANRPGLTAIEYRVGTHSQFRQSMLARLSSSEYPALESLRTRQDDDFSVALLDAWATAADVLTFYQERIANESYLCTAVERSSLLELSRLVGYELNPGVAASTFLAFTIEEAPGAPDQATQETIINTGTKVQSVPGPNEDPQTFETVEEIKARPEWNKIKPRLTMQQPLNTNIKSVTVAGTGINLKQGDRLLIVAGKIDRKVRLITHVEPQEDSHTTHISMDGIKPVKIFTAKVPLLPGTVFSTSFKLTETKVKNQILGKTWESKNLFALAAIQNWSIQDLVKIFENLRSQKTAPGETGVFALRKRVSLFGYNAPRIMDYNGDGNPKTQDKWVSEWSPANESSDKLYLDNAYDEVLPGSYIAINKPGNQTSIHTIANVRTFPRTEYGISSKTTEITLSGKDPWWDPNKEGFSVIRGTAVDILSERLELAESPIEEQVHGNNVLLDKIDLNLKDGQTVILTGEPVDQPGVLKSEVMTIDTVAVEDGFTRLTFTKELANYIRKSVVINANVSRATHGETVSDVLGSGNAGQPYQKFLLRQSPLTFVSAPTPRGSESTLNVRVNDSQWHEVSSFFGRGSDDRIFTTRIDDDGKTTIQFGDGITGKRLPSGQENVRATYRKGMGLEGEVKSGQLTTLLTRPLGVKEVTNPLDAAGADDRESLSHVRRNAPLTVLTLDRAVSLRDYEDFARAFAGVAKALAVWVWDGNKRSIFVTVAGPNGAEIKPESDTYSNLLNALKKSGDPNVGFRIKSYRIVFFRVIAGVKIHPDHPKKNVLESVEQSLREKYSFDERTFGQPVHLSEVTADIQSVPGIMAVGVKKLHRFENYASPSLNVRLEADFPRTGERGDVSAAELLTLDPGPIELEVMP